MARHAPPTVEHISSKVVFRLPAFMAANIFAELPIIFALDTESVTLKWLSRSALNCFCMKAFVQTHVPAVLLVEEGL